MNKHIGSTLDDFLKKDGIFEEAQAEAVKRVIAWQLFETMRSKGITKTRMASMMNTSRSQLNRLLDPKQDVTIGSLQKAAEIVGKKIRIEIIPEDVHSV